MNEQTALTAKALRDMDKPRLTAEDRKLLRAPFAGSAVRWLPVGPLLGGGKQQFIPHVNASLVFERLGEVDPCWTLDRVEPEQGTPTDPLGLAGEGAHRAWLTVKGVTRSGRGTKGPTEPAKSAESDAIKRAALAFEIGAYLRAFETVFLPKQVAAGELFRTKDGPKGPKFSYLTDEGKRQLAGHYTKVMTSKVMVERYGAPIEYGDVAIEGSELHDQSAASEAEQVAAEPQVAANDVQLTTLLLLAKHNGRDTPEDVVEATLKAHPFTKVLPRMLNGVKEHLALDEERAEQLRVLAIKSGEGDADAFAELGEVLHVGSAPDVEGAEQEREAALKTGLF